MVVTPVLVVVVIAVAGLLLGAVIPVLVPAAAAGVEEQGEGDESDAQHESSLSGNALRRSTAPRRQ